MTQSELSPDSHKIDPAEYDRMMQSFLVVDDSEEDEWSEDHSILQPSSLAPITAPVTPSDQDNQTKPKETGKEEDKPKPDASAHTNTTSETQENDASEVPKIARGKDLLTESVMHAKGSSDKGLHMSRHFPQLSERIHQNVQNEISHSPDDEWSSFFRAAPQSTFVLPDLTSLSKHLKDFISQDLFQTSHLTTLERRGVINWNKDLTMLTPLLTQGDGNCLMHAVSLGMYGVHDRHLYLRQALYRTLTGPRSELFKERWLVQASRINRGSKADPDTLEKEWQTIVKEASPNPNDPKAERMTFQYLGQMHVFVIAHILRRPIIVYAESKARDISTEETIFELPSEERIDGIYVPVLLPPEATRSDPLVLSFHSSHFAPLVATLPDFKLDSTEWTGYSAIFPLVSKERVPLPVHYLNEETGEEANRILSEYLNVVQTPGAILAAEQFHLERPDANIALLERYLEGAEEASQAAKPCRAKCGFTGTAAQDGYCSLCYKKVKQPQAVPKLCAANCGFFASPESGFCSSCDRSRARLGDRPATMPPHQFMDLGSPFENFISLLQPYAPPAKQNFAPPQSPAMKPRTYRTTVPSRVGTCRAPNCMFHGTQEQDGYCSVCYKKFVKK